jgi:hypothetical protein
MLEGAVHNGGRAVLEDVALNFVTGDAAVGVAPVRTRDWEAGAVVEVALQTTKIKTSDYGNETGNKTRLGLNGEVTLTSSNHGGKREQS